MSYKLLCWSLSLLGLILVSCSKNDTSGENVVIDIEDEFNLSLREELGTSKDRNLLVQISSIREFDCENYTLNASINLINDKLIHIAVTELIKPQDCIAGMGPATTEIAIGPLPRKEYQLNVDLVNQISNEGILSIYPDYYELSIQEENGVLLAYPRLMRIPDRSVWGYVAFEDNNISVAAEVIEDINTLLEFVDYTPGNYGHFILKHSTDLEFFNEEISAAKNQTFFLRLKDNHTMEDLRKKVEEICPQYQNNIQLKIYTSQGDIISC